MSRVLCGCVLITIVAACHAAAAPPPAEMDAAIAQWIDREDPPRATLEKGMFGDTPWGSTRQSDGSTVLLFVFDPPQDGVLFMPRLGGDISSVEVADRPTPWRAVDDGLLVGLPTGPTDAAFTVVTITFRDRPLVFEAPAIVGPEGAFFGDSAVTLTTSTPLEIRYTTDGADPGPDSPIFTEPIPLRDGMEIRARSYFRGRPVSSVASRSFKRVLAWPAREIGDTPGLLEERYEGRWNSVPDFDALVPRAMRTIPNFGFADSSQGEFIGLRQRGILRVPRDGVYRFELTSDDGSRLWIDGNLVVDNDGLHVARTLAGTAPLAEGGHEIVVEYINATGDSALRLWMGTGPDRMARIPPPDLSHFNQGDEP